jgi:uncharacterized LabA/DUF88 family protein
MKPKYAVLLDGGFVITKLKKKLKKFPTADDIVAVCNRIGDHDQLSEYDLLRAYFYHAPPLSEETKNPIDGSILKLGSSQLFKDSQSLLSTLELKPNFALRLGEAVPMGWRVGNRALKSLTRTPRSIVPKDLVPDIKQKGVDLRIGLDIARLSLCHLVDIIVVVSGDSDLVPAFKFARREGLKIFLDYLEHGVRRELKVHADIVL